MELVSGKLKRWEVVYVLLNFLSFPLKIALYWAQSSQFKPWFMAISDSPGTTL